MKVFRDRRAALLLITLFALGLFAFGCGGGDDGDAPQDITGYWEGTWQGPDGTAAVEVWAKQTGTYAYGVTTFNEVYPVGWEGTYQNGVLTYQDTEGGYGTIHFRGDTASGQANDGSTFTIHRR